MLYFCFICYVQGIKRKAEEMNLQCHLDDPYEFVKRMLPLGLRQVQEIEDHIVSNTSYHQGERYHHPPLKDLVCCRGTKPLNLACQYGDLEAVKRIVAVWGASILKQLESTAEILKNGYLPRMPR